GQMREERVIETGRTARWAARRARPRRAGRRRAKHALVAGVDRDDRESDAEIQVALDDRAHRIAERASDRQHDDAELVAQRIVVRRDRHAAERRVLRTHAPRRETYRGDRRRNEQPSSSEPLHRISVGENRKLTGRMSSRYPGGSEPNALAFAAASTAPSAC